MYSQDFCYWLQGYFELSGVNPSLDEDQVKVVINHLNLVFKHEIDPQHEGKPSILQAIHDGRPPGMGGKDELVRC
jgi:hypothetical protein